MTACSDAEQLQAQRHLLTSHPAPPTYCLLMPSTWIICPETTQCLFSFSFAIKDSPCRRLWRSAFKRWQVPSLRKIWIHVTFNLSQRGNDLSLQEGVWENRACGIIPRNITVTAGSDAAPLVTDKHIIPHSSLFFFIHSSKNYRWHAGTPGAKIFSRRRDNSRAEKPVQHLFVTTLPRVQVVQLRHLQRAHFIMMELCHAGSKASVMSNYSVAAEDVTAYGARGDDGEERRRGKQVSAAGRRGRGHVFTPSGFPLE